MNTTTALLLPLSTRALASIHVLAATTAALASSGGVAASHGSFGYAAGGGGRAGGGGGVDHSNVCYYPTALSSSHTSGNNAALPHHHYYQSGSSSVGGGGGGTQYNRYQHHDRYYYYYTHDKPPDAEWLFSINVVYLLLAPLLLRELPAIMATLDPLIDYLFDGPSSWLAFPGWCAELWSLLREEKQNMIVSRSRRSSRTATSPSPSHDDLDATYALQRGVGVGC